MSGIHLETAVTAASTDPGWWALCADLQADAPHADPHTRRRDVARRLVAAGLDPGVLEAVLPGWSRYLDPPEVDGPAPSVAAG